MDCWIDEEDTSVEFFSAFFPLSSLFSVSKGHDLLNNI